MESDQISYTLGIAEPFKEDAISLYEEAFGKKISVAIGDFDKRIQLLHNCFVLDYAIGAFAEGRLIGLAGFHTSTGFLTGGKVDFASLVSLLGILKGSWAAVILSFYERKAKPGELLMDGICVHRDARGRGIGSRLLQEIITYARENGYARVRLDVIDVNPRAKKLYERAGFKVVKTDHFPNLRSILGFGGVSTMEYKV